MEIEAKEWVRLKDGRIRQFKQYVDKEYIELTRPYNTAKVKDIVNHSKNIIDLIEVGDYVNGHRILEKTKIKNGEMQICILKDNNISNWRTINDKTLKTIVTHEQFANIEYRVEEE